LISRCSIAHKAYWLLSSTAAAYPFRCGANLRIFSHNPYIYIYITYITPTAYIALRRYNWMQFNLIQDRVAVSSKKTHGLSRHQAKNAVRRTSGRGLLKTVSIHCERAISIPCWTPTHCHLGCLGVKLYLRQPSLIRIRRIRVFFPLNLFLEAV
jgi:hypothetical protein